MFVRFLCIHRPIFLERLCDVCVCVCMQLQKQRGIKGHEYANFRSNMYNIEIHIIVYCAVIEAVHMSQISLPFYRIIADKVANY